jgi:hypothetical protein
MIYWGLLIKKALSLYWFSIALDMIKTAVAAGE